jgi:hypothetical protein
MEQFLGKIPLQLRVWLWVRDSLRHLKQVVHCLGDRAGHQVVEFLQFRGDITEQDLLYA